MLVLPCAVLALSALALAVPSEYERDILGLLGGTSTTQPQDRTRPTLKPFTKSSAGSSVQATLSTSEPSTGQSTPTSPTDFGSTSPSTSTPSFLPPSVANDHSSKTWQIIGIAIIAVLFVATSITFAMFFDRLWRFIKDVICCTSHPLVSEQFLPDCENQSWDTRTLSPSPSDSYKTESLRDEAPLHTVRIRELPWNTDAPTLHRQPSRRNDHLPAA